MENKLLVLGAAIRLKQLFGEHFALCFLQDHDVADEVAEELLKTVEYIDVIPSLGNADISIHKPLEIGIC